MAVEVDVAVLVQVGVAVAVKEGVAVAVGLVDTVPPPKSSKNALPALRNNTPIYPPLALYGQADTSRTPIKVPFLYTSTCPDEVARAPKRSPLANVTGIFAPR